jgi:CheY-like chemotaxis protein
VRGQPTVLVADGDGPGRKLVRAVLEPHGYRVFEAADAGDAVALAIEVAPVVILLDLRLPGLDPFEVLGTLAGHPLTRLIPVVATSTSGVADEIERCRDAGFADVLLKPISARDLPELIRRWVSGGAGTITHP